MTRERRLRYENGIAEQICEEYPNISVLYILESASKLPKYVDIFVKIGYALLVIFVVFFFTKKE